VTISLRLFSFTVFDLYSCFIDKTATNVAKESLIQTPWQALLTPRKGGNWLLILSILLRAYIHTCHPSVIVPSNSLSLSPLCGVSHIRDNKCNIVERSGLGRNTYNFGKYIFITIISTQQNDIPSQSPTRSNPSFRYLIHCLVGIFCPSFTNSAPPPHPGPI
jgi:hypothetical protein